MNGSGCVLVVGGTGFVGRALLAALKARARPVVCLVRPGRRGALPPETPAVELPVDQDALRQVVRDSGARTCVHLAAYFRAEHGPTDIGPLVSANVGLTAAVADACAQAGVERLVFTGTVWQHYNSRSYAPMSLYAATKQAACDVLAHFQRNENLGVDVLKLPDTYGPGDTRRKALDLLLDAAARGTSLTMSPGEQLLDLVHVEDVVAALVAMVDRPPDGGWHDWSLGAVQPLSLRELAGVVGRVTGRELTVQWGALPYRRNEAWEPWAAGPRPPGWTPAVTLEDGIARLWEARRSA